MSRKPARPPIAGCGRGDFSPTRQASIPPGTLPMPIISRACSTSGWRAGSGPCRRARRGGARSSRRPPPRRPPCSSTSSPPGSLPPPPREGSGLSPPAPRPPLLLLDELTDGLDPLAREEVLGLLAAHLADTGATAILSTHLVGEVETLVDHVGVLRSGRLIAQAPVDRLLGGLRRYRI